MDLFKKASKEKLRFFTGKGLITVEDLWDLPLTSTRGPSLDLVAQELDAQLKATTTSFVTKTSTQNAALEMGFEIVKIVISEKMEEKELKEQKVLKEQQQSRIRQLLENKKDEELAGKSVEELEALLKE